MKQGIEIRQAHFPGRAPIDAYGNGGFRFADMSHKGSILCLPSGIYGWEPSNLTPSMADLDKVFLEARDVELLFIGLAKMARLDSEVSKALLQSNVPFEVMETGAAARSFNVLLSEGRAVAAVLYAVD